MNIGTIPLVWSLRQLLNRRGRRTEKLSSIDRSPSAVSSRTMRLQRGKMIRLEKDSGARAIEVQSGLVWITGTPATGDALRSGGETFQFRDDWPFIVEALSDAEIRLERETFDDSSRK